MNKITLVGRLVRDPELRTTNSGTAYAKFTIAVDRRFKQEGQPQADFIPVVAWGKQAEIINQYLVKGRQIAVSGRIQISSYDAKDGTKRYATDVVLEEFDFIGSKGEGSATNQDANSGGIDLEDDGFIMMAEDDDLPF